MFRAILTGIVSLGVAVAFAWLPVWLARSAVERAAIDTIFVALLLAAVAFVPFFVKVGHLEPRQFSGVPATSLSIATAMFLSSLLTWSTVWLLVWMAAFVWLRPNLQQEPMLVAAMCVVILLLSVAFSRVSAALVRFAVPRRALSGLRWLGFLLLLAVLPVIVFLMTEPLRSPRSSLTIEAGRVLGWTPFGAPVAGVNFSLAGDESSALSRFVVAIIAIVVLVVCWYALVAVSLRTIEAPDPAGATNSGLESFERFAARPTAVIAARAMAYWRRDPRYRVALLAIPVAPAVMLIALWIAGVDQQVLALLPLPVIVLLLGWSVHNDVAFDSTAIWMHVASGTRGAHDRLGRLVPVLAIGVPLVVIGSSISVTVAGDWRVLPAVIGMNLGVLLSAAAASSMFSAMMPYPATRPGDSPFAQPAIQGSGAGLAQTLSMIVALLFAAGPVWFSLRAIVDPTFLSNVWALVFSVGWGLVVLVFGVWIGGKLFDRNAPELVALIQTFD